MAHLFLYSYGATTEKKYVVFGTGTVPVQYAICIAYGGVSSCLISYSIAVPRAATILLLLYGNVE